MKDFITSPKFVTISIALLALIVIPLTLIQVQSQQSTQQNAEIIAWSTDQSATTACPAEGTGAEILVTFTNTEPKKASTDMDVVAKDQQTGKSVDMGTIHGGDTKISKIQSGKATLTSGSVLFTLTWTDGHTGKDTRTANYRAIKDCITPSITPTPSTNLTPSPSTTPLPSGEPTPTPTICPTLGPVKNVTIDCPNCK